MKGQSFLAALLTVMLLTPAQAGILFKKKKPPVDANQRVPELIGQVKTSPDEHKRSQAAEELRQYDPKAFPDIVPVLMDVLANDPKPPVRAEAAHSLGKLRPVSIVVGQALEQALAKDKSMRVRLQARSALLQYHWAGYRTPKKGGLPPQTKEPPLAPPLPGDPPPADLSLPPPRPVPVPPTAPTEQPLPPLTTRPGTRPLDPSVPVIRLTPTISGATPPLPPSPVPVGPTPPLAPSPAGEKGPELTTPPRW
jgi:hypothetical protein